MKKLDIILIVIYLLISIAGAVYFMVDGLKVHDGGREVVVSVNNEEYERIQLPTSERKVLDIQTDLGHNKIIIEGDHVHIEEADCNDQICVHAGEITKAKEMIVCLPNKVVVEIKGTEKTKVDQIAQ